MAEDNLKSKLNRFQNHFSPSNSNKIHNGKKKKSLSIADKLPDRYYRLAEKMDGKLVSDHAGTYVLIKKLYPLNYFHGALSLGDIETNDIPLSAFTALDEDIILRQKELLFFDTETTGLGGSGTVPFLIGCGSLKENGFEVRQYLLPDYSDETALLEGISREFSSETSLVSYNGAAFDLPLMLDRLIINRVANKMEYLHHVDLLHSTRRLFKRRLKDCRLTNIESELLGFNRHDDTPGYLVPSIYFEWLSAENLELMPSVLEHNRLDIVSLYFLMDIIRNIYRSRGDNLSEVDDVHSLSRVFGRRKELKTVEQLFSRIKEIEKQPLSNDIILYHSLNFKRINEQEKAVSLWHILAEQDNKEGYWANIELAKYFEHRKKDISLALKHAMKAQNICPYGAHHLQQVEKRLKRLKNKQI